MCDFVCHNSHGHVVVLTISKIIHVIEVLHVHLVDPVGMVKVVVGAIIQGCLQHMVCIQGIKWRGKRVGGGFNAKGVAS